MSIITVSNNISHVGCPQHKMNSDLFSLITLSSPFRDDASVSTNCSQIGG